MTVLVIAEHDNAIHQGRHPQHRHRSHCLRRATCTCWWPATTPAAAAAAAQIAGVAKVIHADGEPGHGLAENVAAQVLAIAGNYSHILFPATAGGKNVAPRVAAKLDVAQISDITKVVSADTFERPIYAGNAIATVQSTDATKVITVRTTGFDAAAATGGSAAVETIAAVADSGKSRFKGQRDRQERPPRTDRRQDHRLRWPGLGSSEKFNEVMTPLADKLGAPSAPAARRWTRATPQRLASGPDRQDRGAAAVHGLRHQRAPSSTWPA
jgi:electron transfer flavoprotein alpha subunit